MYENFKGNVYLERSRSCDMLSPYHDALSPATFVVPV